MVHNDIVLDSRMTRAEALAGTNAPRTVTDALRLLEVCYFSFDGRFHRGQLLLHEAVARDVREIFRLIQATRFPVARVVPIMRAFLIRGWQWGAGFETVSDYHHFQKP